MADNNLVERFIIELGIDPKPLISGLDQILARARANLVGGFIKIGADLDDSVRRTNLTMAQLAAARATAVSNLGKLTLQAERQSILAIKDTFTAQMLMSKSNTDRAITAIRLLTVNERLAEIDVRIAKAAVDAARAQVEVGRANEQSARQAALGAAAGVAQMEANLLATQASEARAKAELKLAEALTAANQAQIKSAAAQGALSAGQAKISSPVPGGLSQLMGTFNGALGSSAVALAGVAGVALTLKAALQQLAQFIAESTRESINFQKSQYLLETAVRASQRVMGDNIGTIQEWNVEISRLQVKYKIFTQQDLQNGVKTVLDLTRQFRFGKEEVTGLMESIVVLAQRSGASVEEVAGRASSFMLGQYGRALERYGIDAGEAAIKAEALKLGYKGAFDSLTQAQKAQAAYNIIVQRTAPLMDDATKSLNEYFGKLAESEAILARGKENIGAFFAPMLAGLRSMYANVIEFFGMFARNISILTSEIAAQIGGLYTLMSTGGDFKAALGAIGRIRKEWLDMFQVTRDGLGDTKQSIFEVEESAKKAEKSFVGIAMKIANQFRDAIAELRDGKAALDKEFNQGLKEIGEKASKAIGEATKDYTEKIAEIEEDGAKKRLEIWEKYVKDLEKIQKDYTKNVTEAWEDYNEKLADIDRKGLEKREDLQTELDRELADLDSERNIERQRQEEDHQRKLQDIRDKYAIQIDEAVQKRDARAILNLMRRRNEEIKEETDGFRIKQKREEEDLEIRKEKARKNQAEKLEDLERAEAREREEARRSYEEKLSDLKETLIEQQNAATDSYNEQIKDLIESLREKRAETYQHYQEELAEIRSAMQEQESELRASYRQKQIDLQAAFDERLASIAQNLAEEEGITLASAKAILKVMTDYYGLGGYFDSMIQAFIERYKATITIEMRVTQGLAEAKNTPGDSMGTRPALGRAAGGIDLITSPTLFEVGERGEELMITAPLSRASANEGAMMGFGSSVNVNLDLNVTGRTDLFSYEFEDRVAEVLTDAIMEARGKKR